MKLTKKTIYITLFAILYLIVAFSSFWHAIAFFGLANNSWMSVILAGAFEVGQAAVLFSLLTSKKDRTRVMPWVLMGMFTLVQVIGNVFSSYKYLITNSVENLRFFKEPIFIWTDLPDDQTTVIITYIVGAILPIAALLLTSMITNYLNDNEEEQTQSGVSQLLNDHSVLQMENQGLKEEIDKLKAENESLKLDEPVEGEGRSDAQEIKDLNTLVDNKDKEIENLKKELNKLKNPIQTPNNENESNNDNGEWNMEGDGNKTITESKSTEDTSQKNDENIWEGDGRDNLNSNEKDILENEKQSHFINLTK